MKKYKLVESELNSEAIRVLSFIKEDYYKFMSNKNKEKIDRLIKEESVVVVDEGISNFNDNTLAHGGRTLNDGKIHFYPDATAIKSYEKILETCKKLLPHECFHYFIQPDNIKFNSDKAEKMAHFYTEGLVEKEARKFSERHSLIKQVSFEKANYGFNINFVNNIQEKLRASDYETIFSESDYLKNIENYEEEYKSVLKKKDDLFNSAYQILEFFPKDKQDRIYDKMKSMILQDGNANSLRKNLRDISNINQLHMKELDECDSEIAEK